MVKLDTRSLLADGTSLEGQVVVSVEGKGSVAVPLKVERGPMPSLSELVRISGNTSVVRVARFALWGAPSDPTCVAFTVRVARQIAAAEISTLGLGAATLAPLPAGSAVHAPAADPFACPDAVTQWHERLQLEGFGLAQNRDRWVAVKLDMRSLLADGTSLEGQVVVSVEGKGSVAVPLKVERPPMSSMVTALTWSLGIVFPAILGYWLTRLSDARTDRKKREDEDQLDRTKRNDERAELERKQQEVFLAWRQDPASIAIMDSFFDKEIPATNGLENRCRALFEVMKSKGIVSKMPPSSFEAFIGICEANGTRDFFEQLRILFPEWKTAIDKHLN